MKKAPSAIDRIIEMVRLCPTTLTGLRNQAMLLIGFGDAFHRSELVVLQVGDIIEVKGGLREMIRRNRTDQDGAGRAIAIARGAVHCPVRDFKTWLAAAGITARPVLRKVNYDSRVIDDALTVRGVALLIAEPDHPPEAHRHRCKAVSQRVICPSSLCN
jgi:hypothetical protein